MLDDIAKSVLHKIADITDAPTGAYNIRLNGKSAGRQSSANISITPQQGREGIEIRVKPGTKGEFVHIPVVIEATGLTDMVYNDFYIGEGCDIDIVAGCGIHNTGDALSQHDGIHTFHIGKNAQVRYSEKHYGEGPGGGGRVLNPVTVVELGEGAHFEMDTVQIEGVDDTRRISTATLGDGSSLVIKEKLMTSGTQRAITEFAVNLDGKGCSANLISRSVAKGRSIQEFHSEMIGNNDCAGHSECDAIIMDAASVTAEPLVRANHVDASLIHEAAIGKIAGEQIVKLMTLGLTREQAEAEIVNGFLK